MLPSQKAPPPTTSPVPLFPPTIHHKEPTVSCIANPSESFNTTSLANETYFSAAISRLLGNDVLYERAKFDHGTLSRQIQLCQDQLL